MIILDTHIWVWWVHGDERLTRTQTEAIEANEADIIGVSAISAWEIAITHRTQSIGVAVSIA